jgi:gas vesicle protein
MFAGILIGAAVASVVAFGWAASKLRWLDAQCRQQIAYWRDEAERSAAAAAWLREQLAAGRPDPGSATATGQRDRYVRRQTGRVWW